MKKVPKEAAPDPEELAVEERVRQLMDPTVKDEPTTPPVAAKAIKVISADPPEAPAPEASAPETPDTSAPVVEPPKIVKRRKIAIAHDEEEAPTPEPKTIDVQEDTLGPKTPDEVEAAIEAANEQLQTVSVTPITDKTVAPEPTAPLLPSTPPLRKKVKTTEEPLPETVPEFAASDTPSPVAVPPQPQVRDIFTPDPLPPEQELPDLPPVFEDEETSKAVEDIIVRDGDQLLKIQDEADEPELVQAEAAPEKTKKRSLLKYAPVRWALALVIIGGLIALGAVPSSRYYALNHAGIRSSASIIVFDQSTQQPLKNVTVTVAGQQSKSDSNGRANITNVPLGPTQIKIEKRAFAPITITQTIGWGSNPLGEYKLTPTGTQYGFTVTDYVSGKPIKGVEASSGEAAALSDEKGVIRLTIDHPTDTNFAVSLKLNGYREEIFDVSADAKGDKPVKLVLARKHVFVTKRSGRFDVYKIDIDGKHEARILAGTGSERDDMVLVPHPSDEYAAFVSTRDNKRNTDGFLLSSLTMLNISDDTSKVVASSERLQIVDWVGSRLIFVQIAAGESAESPKRHRLMSYDFKTQDLKEIASSNFFNDVVILEGKVYFAPSSAYQTAGEAGLYRSDVDGSNRVQVLNKEVWNIFRSGYGELQLSTPQDWYDFRVGSQPAKLAGAPANPATRVYIDSPNGKSSLWVDKRDGKGVLLFYDLASKKDSIVRSQNGLGYPIRWLDDSTLIFRMTTESETADYALSLNGGEGRKIADVTNTGGVDKWYYY